MPVRTPTPRRPSQTTRRPRLGTTPTIGSHLLAGVIGGLVVLAIGATLIGTGIINSGDTSREIIREVPAGSAPLAKGSARLADGSGGSVSSIYKRIGGGVVFISARVVTAEDSPFGVPLKQEGLATGSGFVLDKRGYILTNAHVVEGARNASIRFEEGGDFVEAKVVGQDLSSDIAVLKVDASDAKLQPVPLGNSRQVQVGDPVIAIGNPFGYTRTVTTGIISALQRQIKAPNGFAIGHVIQTDAPINPGNSGGPLLNARGEVIGINSQIATAGTAGSVGIGFAVPINTAKRVIPQLEQHGRIVHAYLGVTTFPLSKELVRTLNLPVEHGALVQEVSPGAPAARIGLKAGRIHTDENVVLGGDIVVEVDGQEISKPEDLTAAINDHQPGDVVEIKFYRGNKEITKSVKLSERPAALDQQAANPDLSPDLGGDSGTLP